MPETAPHAEAGMAASDDVDELKQQTEQTVNNSARQWNSWLPRQM